MPDGYGVLTGELRAHASHLDGLRDRLNTALEAANQVNLGDEAHRQLCSVLVPTVHAVSDPGGEALREAAGSMSSTATGVRTSATSYDQTEQATTKPFAGTF